MKKNTILLSVVLCSLFLLAGCGGTNNTDTISTSQEESIIDDDNSDQTEISQEVESCIDDDIPEDEDMHDGTMDDPYTFGTPIKVNTIIGEDLSTNAELEITPLEINKYGVKVNVNMIKSDEDGTEITNYPFLSLYDENGQNITSCRWINTLKFDDYKDYYERYNDENYEDDEVIKNIEFKSGKSEEGFCFNTDGKMRIQHLIRRPPKYLKILYYENKNDLDNEKYIEKYIKIPDEIFDISLNDNYEYGADTAEDAFDLYWKSIYTHDEEIARRLSMTYYLFYGITDKDCIANPTWNNYLNINNNDIDYYNQFLDLDTYNFAYIEGNYDDDFEKYIESVSNLSELEDYIMKLGSGDFNLQAGYIYNYPEFGVEFGIYEIDGRWFVVSDIVHHDNSPHRTYGINYQYAD